MRTLAQIAEAALEAVMRGDGLLLVTPDEYNLLKNNLDAWDQAASHARRSKGIFGPLATTVEVRIDRQIEGGLHG